MSNKPVVHFTKFMDGGEPVVGFRAIITGLSGHTNLQLNGGQPVLTSTVQKVINEREFETVNTHYKMI